MGALLLISFLFARILSGHASDPVVSCPAPRSPDHGQAFLYQDGSVVKYVCEPGYSMVGKETLRCIAGEWEDNAPLCLPNDVLSEEMPLSPSPPEVPARLLFDWDEEKEIPADNATSLEEQPQGDEGRVSVMLYPRQRLVTSRRVARIRTAAQLEEEEKKRREEKSPTTIQLQGPPSTVFVRRTVYPGKEQDAIIRQQYRTATVLLDRDPVQVVQMPRQAVSGDEKGEEALYRTYLWAQHYLPRQASLVDYRADAPVSLALTESQIAWINSLHPELRDRYLRDLYVQRAEAATQGARAQAFLRRYDYPNYVRQPLAIVTQDLISHYDYSCNQAGSPFVKAPKLPNAHIARYDRRQNQNQPHNHYLAAVYRCDSSHVMLDTRFTELFCSRGTWIGTEPICIPRP